MVFGAINEKGEKYYTDLVRVFEAINNKQMDYNWLITDCVCYPQNPETAKKLDQEYCWISGDELTDLVFEETSSGYGVFCLHLINRSNSRKY